jgi:hypothetical protein
VLSTNRKEHVPTEDRRSDNRMRKEQLHWRWDVGAVDERKEHIELRHSRAGETTYEKWLPVARIGKPKSHCFPVQWLFKSDAVENEALIADAREELDFHRLEKTRCQRTLSADGQIDSAVTL